MSNSTRSHYTFGDQGSAAERLRRLAALYRPVSAEALEEAVVEVGPPVHLAIDLGSGPDFTTELVAEVTQARQVIGFERSADFCSQARARVRTGIEFVEHDVSTDDLPCQNIDLAFCRFWLTHLANPVVTLRRWREGSARGLQAAVASMQPDRRGRVAGRRCRVSRLASLNKEHTVI